MKEERSEGAWGTEKIMTVIVEHFKVKKEREQDQWILPQGATEGQLELEFQVNKCGTMIIAGNENVEVELWEWVTVVGELTSALEERYIRNYEANRMANNLYKYIGIMWNIRQVQYIRDGIGGLRVKVVKKMSQIFPLENYIMQLEYLKLTILLITSNITL